MSGACLVEESAARFLAGRLPPREADRIKDHLAGCDDCRALISEIARFSDPWAGARRADLPLAPEDDSGPQPHSLRFREGEIIDDKFRFERLIGRGGMGMVVAAMHLQLDQPVALKFMHPAIAADENCVERFRREAKAAARLKSEHVGRVLDLGTLPGGDPYIVMEYLEGENLAQLIRRRGPLPVDEAVSLVLQACSAISEAHAVGIIHRDLKPSNLFVTERPDGASCLKVLDFGISKLLDDSAITLTATTGMLGSPRYMAPEQLVSAKTVDTRADIWAIGICLYQALTGAGPFESVATAELVTHVLGTDAPKLSTKRHQLPDGLDAVVSKCLERDRDERYADVAELIAALEPFRPSAALPRAPTPLPRAPTPLPRAPTPLPGASAPIPVAQSPGRPLKHFFVAVGVVAALAAVALTVALTGGDETPAEQTSTPAPAPEATDPSPADPSSQPAREPSAPSQPQVAPLATVSADAGRPNPEPDPETDVAAEVAEPTASRARPRRSKPRSKPPADKPPADKPPADKPPADKPPIGDDDVLRPE